MQFYQYRQKSLLQYMKYKKQPPTTWTLLKAGWRLFAICGVLIPVYAAFLHKEGIVEIKMFVIGMFFGIMLMAFGRARLVANMTWPVQEEVIDWDLVEEKCSAIESSR